MKTRSLLPRRAPEGPPAVGSDRRRLARLARRVRKLEAERDELREDLAHARAWVRDLFSWIERAEAPAGRPAQELAREPGPLRRAATIAALVSAPWLLVGGGIAAGLALG